MSATYAFEAQYKVLRFLVQNKNTTSEIFRTCCTSASSAVVKINFASITTITAVPERSKATPQQTRTESTCLCTKL